MNFEHDLVIERKSNWRVHINQDGVAQNINPFDHGSSKYTDIMKTQGLKQALNKGKYDAAFGGARREEENLGRRNVFFPLETAFTNGIQKPTS